MRTAAYNIRVGGVGVTMAHNEIHDAPHQAILLLGNDHLFELNNMVGNNIFIEVSMVRAANAAHCMFTPNNSAREDYLR